MPINTNSIILYNTQFKTCEDYYNSLNMPKEQAAYAIIYDFTNGEFGTFFIESFPLTCYDDIPGDP